MSPTLRTWTALLGLGILAVAVSGGSGSLKSKEPVTVIEGNGTNGYISVTNKGVTELHYKRKDGSWGPSELAIDAGGLHKRCAEGRFYFAGNNYEILGNK